MSRVGDSPNGPPSAGGRLQRGPYDSVMALPNFIPGTFDATYTAAGLAGDAGRVDVQGGDQLGRVTNLRCWRRGVDRPPRPEDVLCRSLADGVYRGGQCFCLVTFKRWTDAMRDTLWPWGEKLGTIEDAGGRLIDRAGVLALRSVTGPAGIGELVFGRAAFSWGHSNGILTSRQKRNVPIVFRCFPYANREGRLVWFENRAQTGRGGHAGRAGPIGEVRLPMPRAAGRAARGRIMGRPGGGGSTVAGPTR